MKRKLTVIAALTIILAVLAAVGAGALIRASAKGRTYSDVSLIPYRRVGLLLGCSRRLPGGRANLFFSYRMTAAARLFKAKKIDYLIVSGDSGPFTSPATKASMPLASTRKRSVPTRVSARD